MSKASFKRQKVVANKPYEPLIPPTKYDPSPATLKNFPSSIVNGVTSEGGLFSLTFKAVTAASYIENADLIRKSLFDSSDLDLSQITDKEFEGEKKLQTLKEEVSQLKSESTLKSKITEESPLKDKLQQDLESGENLTAIGKQLIEDYHIANPNKSLVFSVKAYNDVYDLKIPDLKVDKFEDVKDVDLKPYQKESTAVVETVSEPVVEPVVEPSVEQVAEPVIEAVHAPVAASISEPTVEPVVEPIAETVVETVVETIIEPVVEPVVVPVAAPFNEPVAEPDTQTSTIHPTTEQETTITEATESQDIVTEALAVSQTFNES
ncbi:hypothetical protein DFJ63DRAFT_93914 [Scheffersomyces coipomensis]|uniref:uncharacterized protein n=1 Tax=Scheffersomyces coipomensis TaxID=1788519 RepID=UPI00315DCF7E